MFFPPSYGLDYSSAPSIFLEYRRFRPSAGDVLKKSYPTPEGPRVLALPPYTLSKGETARKTMESFFAANFEFLFPELKVGSVGAVFGDTFDEAKRFSKDVSIFCY